MEAVKADVGMTKAKEVEAKTEFITVQTIGGPLRLTRAERITLIATAMDPEGYAKLVANGFGFERKKGLLSDVVKGPEGLVQTVVDSIIAEAPRADVEIAAAMVETLTGMGKAGNRAALVLKGYEPFTKTAYFPLRIERAGTQENTELEAKNFFQTALENMGFTKARVKHKNPLLIGDAFEVFREHSERMSRLAHLSVPIRDVLTVLGNPEFQEAALRHFGEAFKKRTRDMVRTLAGLRDAEPVQDLPKLFQTLGRNASVSMLWMRPTSILFNRVGGSILAAAELAHIDERLAGAFLARTSMPVSLKTDSGKADLDTLMTNGYLWRRWTHDLAAVFSPLREQEGLLNTKAALKWRQMQDWGLNPMAKAEQRNAIAMLRTLRANGYSDADALALIEKITRATQNPSSALEESSYYIAIRRHNLGWLFPFIGQPAVARNLIVRDAILMSRATGAEARKQAKGLAYSVIGLAAGLLFENTVRAAIREIGNRAGGGDDEDEKRKRRILDGIANAMDYVVPGMGKLIVDATATLVGSEKFDVNTSISATSFAKAIKAIATLTADGGDPAQKRRAVLNMLEGLGTLVGAPVGGPSQIARAVAGPAMTTTEDRRAKVVGDAVAALPENPSGSDILRAVNAAYNEAKARGTLPKTTQDGKPLSSTEQRQRIEAAILRSVEKQRGADAVERYRALKASQG